MLGSRPLQPDDVVDFDSASAPREAQLLKGFYAELRQLARNHQDEINNCVDSLVRGLQQVNPAFVQQFDTFPTVQLDGNSAQRSRNISQPLLVQPIPTVRIGSGETASSDQSIPVAIAKPDGKMKKIGAAYEPGLPGVPQTGDMIDTTPFGADAKTTPGGGKKKKGKQRRPTDKLFKKTRDKVLAEQSVWQKIAYSVAYEWFSGILIVCNSAFLGWQSQRRAVLAREDATGGIDPSARDTAADVVHFEVTFALLFSVELMIRWIADGFIGFLMSQDFGWNIFDISIVSLSWVEIVLEAMALAERVPNISIFRILRVVRIVRVVRVIRVMRFFRELRMMISSILNSVISLVWVFLVLGLVFFIFGINFTDGTIAELDTMDKFLNESNQELLEHFGTLDRSIMSLYQAMSGGNDWGVYYESLGKLPAQFRLSWIVYITFAIFAVVNIVTGVFVESALAANNSDRENVISEELEFKKQYLQTLQAIFEELDHDATGYITSEEFEHALQEERVVAYFRALKLDVTDAQTLFKLLDYDQSEEISIEEFLDGCYRLQGESRTLDVKLMQYEVRFLKEAMVNIMEVLRGQQQDELTQ
mmetsp:Transcript_16197/g.37243  ORF Transcript_16197/g.37243 Transcript_16197/m.37243 type:complete len:590 (-) Transcript_16197:162-1931(-)